MAALPVRAAVVAGLLPDRPRLSIVIPVLNEADCLARTLDRIFADPWLREHAEVLVSDGGSDDETCDAEPLLFQLHRMLIYVRNYSRRRGDGVPALMMSRLATEPEPRWLRSDMLASGVFDWDLRERVGTHRSRAVTVRFSVKGKHQSTSVDRTILLEIRPLQLRPSVFRPVDRRPDARLALDLAWP